MNFLKYVSSVYSNAFILCIAFIFNNYSIEIIHVETSTVGRDTWLTTLVPDSIVFEVDSSFMHVHKVKFGK